MFHRSSSRTIRRAHSVRFERSRRPFGRESYLPDRGLATAVYLALAMRRPLLLEGEAGVGKTEVAKTLAADPRRRPDPAAVLRGDRRLAGALRVGLRAPAALRARPAGGRGRPRAERVAELYGPRVPARAAAAAALRAGGGAVLLIDELDRADDEFEAFLLEMLSDFSRHDPRARDDRGRGAARRRDHVEPHARAARRAQAPLPLPLDRLPGRSSARSRSSACARPASRRRSRARSPAAVARLRELDLVKRPGAAEAIDWARALALLGADVGDGEAAAATLGWAVKNRDDLARVERGAGPSSLE